GRAETAREPGERPRPEARPQVGHALADRAHFAFPEFGVSLFDRAEASVNLRQLRVLLGQRQRSVERGAVDLALQIGPVAPSRIFLGHLRLPFAAAGDPTG